MICMYQKKKVLMITTSVCAGLSTVLLVMAVASEHWLYCKELYKGVTRELYFVPHNFTGSMYIATNFGLWRSCQQYVDKDDIIYKSPTCTSIKYKDDPDSAREGDSIANAIIRNCRITTIFPMLSIFFEISGDICCLLGYLFGKRRYLVFLTGVIFVVSGMSLLAGTILFMGAVTGEANHQPRVTKDETPAFRYSFGSSFVMMAMAFCLDEVSGVLSVYLFIIRHKETVKRKHAKLQAYKSKADHVQNFLKKKSRNQSLSGNGEVSRRSSYMPGHPECVIDRDLSHTTIMTTVESHHHLKNLTEEKRNDLDTTQLLANHNHATPVQDETTPLFPISILPPPPIEFQTVEAVPSQQLMYKDTPIGRCKTTSV